VSSSEYVEALQAGADTSRVDRVHLVQLVASLRPAWMADALCREFPQLSWFPERGESVEPAKAVCARCLVAEECERYAADQPAPLAGIWAGESARSRRNGRRAA